MNELQSDSEPSKPTDADMKWTAWALDQLRYVVELDIRTKRMTAQEQDRRLQGAEPPEYPLAQSRLSRSVRLSIAMIERIRADYLMRAAEREGSGQQERRRKRREQASEAVAQAVAVPGDVEDVEHVRSLVRETLVEDEILDVQIDQLSPEEFLRAVCRKIGRPPPEIPLPLPLVWDDISGPPGAGPGRIAMASRPLNGWADDSGPPGAGPSRPALPRPDSS